MQFHDDLFERNILALSTKNPGLANRVSRTASSSELFTMPSKTGLRIPGIRSHNRDSYLHSRFDPQREADRIAAVQQGSGYLIIFGLGAGYHIQPFLHRSGISDILILDRDISLFRSLLEEFDYRTIFLDPRVQILIDQEPDQLRRYLLDYYHPAVMGNLNTVKLPSRIRLDPAGFENSANAIRRVVNNLADDYTVQATFGNKWFINTLRNLPSASRSTTTLRPSRRIAVTGAGPSLEDQLPEIRHHQETGCTLLATDTSLPVLTAHGIKPNIVISIDCQQISYHHFLQGYPRDVPLVLDLASPPEIARLSDRPFFFCSGHPLSLFINRRFRAFPLIDTSGGNVSHAAVSLASLMGAQEIYLYGTDFSYPQGKLYSRGTYIYPYFRSRESRLNPVEGAMIGFLFRNTNIMRTKDPAGYRYTTKPMISYKKRLEDAAAKLPSRVIPASGRGETLSLCQPEGSAEKDRGRPATSPFLTAGSAQKDWQDFLSSYIKDLEALPHPTRPLGRYFAGLTHKQRDLWTTLFPSAAHFRQTSSKGRFNAPPHANQLDSPHPPLASAILEETLRWSLASAERFLAYQDQ